MTNGRFDFDPRFDPRQCPLCFGADQHERGCVLNGKKHIYFHEWLDGEVDWSSTLRLHGIPEPLQDAEAEA